MNWVLLYFLMLKATLTTFNGQSSFPVVRQDFVVTHHLVTDQQLNAAVAAGQSSPGPMGIFIVSVGYFAGGATGAFLGWLAVITPAFLVIPMLRFAGNRVEHPRIKSALAAAVTASAGLILLSIVPIGQVAIYDGWTLTLATTAFLILLFSGIPTVLVVAGAALIGLLRSML